MKINISAQNFKLSKAIESFIEKKMRKYLKLGQKLGKIEYKFKSHPSKKSYESKFSCELNISLDKGRVIVKEASSDLYALIDLISEKAEREIRKHKEKRQSILRKSLIRGKKLLQAFKR